MADWISKGETLIKDIADTVTGDNSINLWYLGQTGYAIKYLDKLFLIDPIFNDFCDDDGKSVRLYDPPFNPELLRADVVFCTHAHIDHMAPPTIKALLTNNKNLKVVIPVGSLKVALDEGIPEGNIITVRPSEVLYDFGCQISVVPTAHPEYFLDETNEEMSVAYNILFGESGITVTHLGDTYLREQLVEDVKSLHTDILFVPINGDDDYRRSIGIIGNMSSAEASEFSALIRPNVVIPTHFDLVKGNTSDPEDFEEEIKCIAPDIAYRIMKPGEYFQYKNER